MYQAAIMGAGMVLQAYGTHRANQDQAKSERKNAGYYMEQADYFDKVGDRQEEIFDYNSKVLVGNQVAGFAKSGVNSAEFMARESLFRSKEVDAIRMETNKNVRAATLKADEALSNSRSLTDPGNNFLQAAGSSMSGAASVL